MFQEIYQYLTTPCAVHARRMGYLYEAVAMKARSERCGLFWRNHINRSRHFILEAAGRCADRRRAVILGAGLLLDVPLSKIASMFNEVVLVDVVFLRHARNFAGKFPMVVLLEHDVTGSAEALYRLSGSGRAKKKFRCAPVQDSVELPKTLSFLPKACDDAGMVVSLNMLSQIAMVPREYAVRNLRRQTSERIDAWCRDLVEAHYAALRSLSGRVCMVSDFWYLKRDQHGVIIEEGSTIEGMVLPNPDETWLWDVAPPGELSRTYCRELRVGAWDFADEGRCGTRAAVNL